MDTTDKTTNTSTTTKTYGNLEITVEEISDKELNDLLDTIIEKVESLGLELVARTYKTTDADYKDYPIEETKVPPTTKEG